MPGESKIDYALKHSEPTQLSVLHSASDVMTDGHHAAGSNLATNGVDVGSGKSSVVHRREVQRNCHTMILATATACSFAKCVAHDCERAAAKCS